MTTLTFTNSGYDWSGEEFYQYDYGQKMEIKGLTIPDGTQIHFAPKGNLAYIVFASTIDGTTTVDVPQSALMVDGELNIYIFETTSTSGKTLRSASKNVIKREKPGDYAPPDEPYVVEILQAKLDQIIQTGIADYTPDPQDVKDIIDEYVPTNYIVNSLLATAAGKALDATQGKALKDMITALSDSLSNYLTLTAFAGKVKNSLTETATGNALDAVQGKALKTLIDSINAQIDTINTEIASIGIDTSIIGNDYSASSTYTVGALCIYDGALYRCSTSITTPEAWNAAHWTATNTSSEIVSIRNSSGATCSATLLAESNATAETQFTLSTGSLQDYKAIGFTIRLASGSFNNFVQIPICKFSSAANNIFYNNALLADGVTIIVSAVRYINNTTIKLYVSNATYYIEAYGIK